MSKKSYERLDEFKETESVSEEQHSKAGKLLLSGS
jgi:hypothetical protein